MKKILIALLVSWSLIAQADDLPQNLSDSLIQQGQLEIYENYFTTYENGYMICFDEADTLSTWFYKITKKTIKPLPALMLVQYYHYCEFELPNQLYKITGYVILPEKQRKKSLIFSFPEVVFY